MTRSDKTYLDTLLLYYEEEVEGEAYFYELAKRFDDAVQKEKLVLLAEVERHAAQGVAPLVAKYGLKPQSTEELTASGRKDARGTVTEWASVVAGMNETYPGYLVSFKKLEAMAPPEDLPRLTFLTEHEVAAIAFLDLEARDPSQSEGPLRNYLATDPEEWVAAAE